MVNKSCLDWYFITKDNAFIIYIQNFNVTLLIGCHEGRLGAYMFHKHILFLVQHEYLDKFQSQRSKSQKSAGGESTGPDDDDQSILMSQSGLDIGSYARKFADVSLLVYQLYLVQLTDSRHFTPMSFPVWTFHSHRYFHL